ncbi:heavy-metal-associated domain-containing protein [Camelliibacillus cellulosilyticus]|uniref:Heavy-metal-associated domain-containing protein n=1 Tax=Camelliibacillus cellulosilyticus TaxID=2174486 RepID=A0ABV9GPN2_9BACL
MRKWLVFGLSCVAMTLIILLAGGEKVQKSAARGHEAVFTGVDFSCRQCESKMKTAIENIIGIEKYRLDPEKNAIRITYDPDIMHARWIEKSLRSDGFKFNAVHY